MNVAEYTHDSRLLECLALRSSRSVESDIEGLAAEVGKRIVKDGIKVGKVDGAAGGNGDHVRSEMTVALDHLDALRGRRRYSGAVDGFQPDDHARIILELSHGGVARVGDLHRAADAAGAARGNRRERCDHAKTDKPAPGHSDC